MGTEKRFSRESLLPLAERLFLAACGCYYIFRTGVLNRFFVSSWAKAENTLIYVLLALALFRLMCLWPREKKLVIGAAVLAAVMAVISFLNGFRSPGAFSVLILGCAGLRFERLAKVRAVIWIWYTLGMVFGGLTGFFPVFVAFNQGALRSAWGFSHPVTMACHVFLSVLFLWLAFPPVPDWIILLFSLISLWIAKDVCHSETGLICSILMMVLALLHMVPVQKWFSDGWKKRLLQAVRMLMSLSFPLLAAFYFYLVWQFREGSEFAITVNEWITGRLALALEGFQEYGIPAFGSDYQIHAPGDGGYNVLDSLYALAVIRYGWVFLAVMALSFVFFSLRCFRSGNRKIVYGMVVAAVYSFAEPLFEYAHVNLFLCMAFCDLAQVQPAWNSDPEKEKRRAQRPARIAAASAVAVLLLLITLFLPKIFSCMRTVYLRFDWIGKDERVFLLMAAVFLVTGTFLVCVYRMVYALWQKERPSKRLLAVTGACCLLFAFSALKVGSMVRAERQTYAQAMEELEPVMELVCNASEGQVIADALPEVFADYYPGITRSWRRSEELAFEEDITLITSRWVGQQQLNTQGFRYLQMSEIHSLYTDDTAVVQALREAGYHIASYDYSVYGSQYSGPENEFQGIPVLSEEEGGTGNLTAGLNGVYTVEFDLNFLEGRPQHDLRGEALCTLRAWSVKNNTLIAERTVYGDEVGRSGWNTYELRFSAWGLVNLSVIAGETYPMRLTEIRYRQTPDYDVFDTTDEEGRVLRREYYDLEGNPATIANGASIITYEYDEAGNNTVQYYFDAEGNPVMITSGYAGLHRTFDEEKRIIHEHYTGAEGEPVAIPAGYAAYEAAYDAAGNATVYRYYDTAGNLVMLPGGYAVLYRDYNENKQMIRQRTIDTQGNPATVPAGHAMQEYGYDAAGNTTDYYYFDRKDRPVMISAGYAELHRSFDDAKRIIREAYADTEGKPVLIGSGYAELHRVYNDRNQIAEESYFDQAGQPVMLTTGYAIDERAYDAVGNLILQRFYDVQHKPVPNTSGVCEIRRQYDDAKRLIWEEYADTEGNPAARPDGVWAFARVYGEDGTVTEEAYYDIKGEPFTP